MFVSTVKNIDGKLTFELLTKVALLVLAIPHSNAEEQRISPNFIQIMKLDETLASTLTMKVANPQPCYKFEPPQEVLESAKRLLSLTIEHT